VLIFSEIPLFEKKFLPVSQSRYHLRNNIHRTEKPGRDRPVSASGFFPERTFKEKPEIGATFHQGEVARETGSGNHCTVSPW
jgi:hypothetical protein